MSERPTPEEMGYDMSATDDTRQRSVAEIIGWEYTDDGYVILPNGERHEGHIRVDPDDMRAWLHERRFSVVIEQWEKDDAVNIAVRHWDHWDEQWVLDYTESHSTLQAALEAAVRAVAEVGDD